MEKLNKFSKILLTISAVFFVTWLGGYITRHIAVYGLFESDSLILNPEFNNQNLVPIFKILTPVINVTLISYPIMLVTFLLFLGFSKISLKKEGWLFISTVLIIITAPFEIYLMTLDYDFVNSVLAGNFSSHQLFNILKERITALSSFSLVEIFSYFGIIFLFLFKPMRKIDKHEN